jgi:hypothetical protein
MRASTLGILSLLAIGIATSCGGAQRNGVDPRKNEITALWTQIRDWRREAGLQVDPRVEDMNQVIGTPVREVQRVCPDNHPVPPTCSDVCSLADAICDNAEQICILADQLGKQDTWAQDKCTSAKASCREAKKKCCAKCSETKATWLSPPPPAKPGPGAAK